MKRSKFSLSHYKLLTCQMGGLIPIAWYEVLPGDTIQMATSCLVRAAPLNAPIMHPVQVRIHHFFVPNRIIWSTDNNDPAGGWEAFITGGANGLDNTTHPFINFSTNQAQSSLADYLGLPTANMPGGGGINVNALPFRAYQLIWNSFYRDEDLQTAAVVSTASGGDSTTSQLLQNCCWEKDYVTSARTTESKGPAISMFPPGSSAQLQMSTGATATTHNAYPGFPAQAANTFSSGPALAYDSTTDASVAGTQFFTNLGSGTFATDINLLRQQFALARYQENRLRFGSRYTEYLRYLGVRSSDARLQRPEYLGGGRQTIAFSEVLQTGVTTSGTAQLGIGAFGGHGISAMRSNRFRRFFEEHGLIMSMMSIRPRTMYSNPVRRSWLHGMLGVSQMTGTKQDYWQKELQFIGQQQIAGVEVDASYGLSPTAFGFQDRYDEYRRLESSVHGAFRSSPLDVWHLSREFASAPSLNSTFVSCVPSTRIFQVTSGDNCYVMCNHSIQARRLVAKTATPKVF